MVTSATSSSRPKRLAKYTIRERLGSGGMSKVYRAIADGTNHEVALKVTPVNNDIGVEVVDYQREVIIGRRVKHPLAVAAFDHGCRAGYIYLAMPMIKGATLSNSTRLRDPSRKPSSGRSSAYRDKWIVPMLEGQWAMIASIGLQMSEALVACHAAGVIHRDIKPANIMLTREGTAHLTDFGLAWMRRGPIGHQLETRDGTARYLPPEVFDGRRDERSDIYSLGFTLHELATGLKPWGEIDHETVKIIRPELRVPDIQSIRSDVPESLAACIDCATAHRPEDRFQTAEAMAMAFRETCEQMSLSNRKRFRPVTWDPQPERVSLNV
jgi:serine/threonine protein kinase